MLKLLIAALTHRHDSVREVADACDARGEDAALNIDDERTPVQIVSLPADSLLWRELSAQDAAAWNGALDDSVAMVRRALEHKRGKVSAGTILAMDAAHFGAIAGAAIVSAYLARHGDPEAEFSLREVWIVGPSERSTVRLRAGGT